jgi:osmotically-inducible protein OsmY
MKPAVDAAKLRDSIEEALARRAEREARRITIEVEGDVVRLDGSVHSWAEKNAIERLVAYSPGVRHIQNDIVVDPYT